MERTHRGRPALVSSPWEWDYDSFRPKAVICESCLLWKCWLGSRQFRELSTYADFRIELPATVITGQGLLELFTANLVTRGQYLAVFINQIGRRVTNNIIGFNDRVLTIL